MKLNTLDELFHEELKDIYDAEQRLSKALPKMAKAAHSAELKEALQSHLEVTKTQVARLEEVFQLLGAKPTAKTCMGMKGLLEEGDEAMSKEGEAALLDLAIIGAARRVEHYEIAAYHCLHDLAGGLDVDGVQELISASLEEETSADESLAECSLSLLSDVSSESSQQKTPGAKKGPAKAQPAMKRKAMQS